MGIAGPPPSGWDSRWLHWVLTVCMWVVLGEYSAFGGQRSQILLELGVIRVVVQQPRDVGAGNKLRSSATTVMCS